tara:strand:+ start:63449 stop:64732 length:1284 start_codon:yes stop_codon:yes gene_type:complete
MPGSADSTLDRLKRQIAEAFVSHPPDVLGVAVSGGGDSIALLHLLHKFCAPNDCQLRAVTVNHGLRPEAAKEAEFVADQCARLNIPHDTLHWRGWDGQGNLQNAARKARYALIADWARTRDLKTVALGHTADDQAETVLMRLARQSGVDGLSGMARRSPRNGITLLRPLLGAMRADLRTFLADQGIDWCDDPSNEDPTYDRIRARQALDVLAPLGIDALGLAEVAANMAQARTALDWQSFLAAREIVKIDGGAVVIDDRGLRILPDEIQRRLFIHALNWVSGSSYPPRRRAVADMILALRRGEAATLDGCHARRVNGRIWVFRELNAVRDLKGGLDSLWDGRWRVVHRDEPDAMGRRDVTVRVLGSEGLKQCPDWRSTGRPHTMLLSSPAIWQGDVVLAAPLAGHGEKWHVQVDGGEETFFAAILSH